MALKSHISTLKMYGLHTRTDNYFWHAGAKSRDGPLPVLPCLLLLPLWVLPKWDTQWAEGIAKGCRWRNIKGPSFTSFELIWGSLWPAEANQSWVGSPHMLAQKQFCFSKLWKFGPAQISRELNLLSCPQRKIKKKVFWKWNALVHFSFMFIEHTTF